MADKKTDEEPAGASEEEIAKAVDDVVEALEPEVKEATDKNDEIIEAVDEALDAEADLADEGAKEIDKATKGMSDEDVNAVADRVYERVMEKVNGAPPVNADALIEEAETPPEEVVVEDEPPKPDVKPKSEHFYFRERGKKDDN